MNERSISQRRAIPITPADSRTRVLDAARKLFYEQGYHATGVATILREAGVNSGTMYHFFPSKEALLVGVLEWYRDNLWPEVLTPAEGQAAGPVERVFALMGLYRLGMEMTGCTMGCPVGNLALELSDNHPAVRELIDLNFRNWIAGVRGWLEAAGDRLPRGTDLDALAGFVLTVMEGGIMRSRAAGSLEPFDESVAQLRAYFDLLEHAAATAKGNAR